MSRLTNGHWDEIELLITMAQSPDYGSAQQACAGVVLSKVANYMVVYGRLDEAEMYAAKSIHILERFYPAKHVVFLLPLNVIASVRFEHGQIGRAREAFQRMQALHVEGPEDRATVHAFSGSLLVAERRYPEAESAYVAAIRLWEQAGHGEMADTGTVYAALGSLYITERRFDDARRALNSALSIFTSAKDAVPVDRFKLLQVRARVEVGQHRWREAERNLEEAASLADSLPGLDPILLLHMLRDYATVLRRDHRRREARAIEARAAILERLTTPNAAIDASELLAQSKRSKK